MPYEDLVQDAHDLAECVQEVADALPVGNERSVLVEAAGVLRSFGYVDETLDEDFDELGDEFDFEFDDEEELCDCGLPLSDCVEDL